MNLKVTWTFILRDSPDVQLPSPGLTFLYGAEATGMPTLLVKQGILRLNKTWMALLVLDVKLNLWMWMSEELSHWPAWPLESKMLKGGDVRYRNHHTTLGSFGCRASISTLKKGVRPVGNCRPHPITMATTWQQKSDTHRTIFSFELERHGWNLTTIYCSLRTRNW